MRNLFIITFLFAAVAAQSQPVAQWRGANRDGIYNESAYSKTWPAEGPKLLWETEIIGNGYGSPVVSENILYVNGEIDSISHLFAFDLSGNLRWKAPNGREFIGDGFSAGFPGSRSAPTVYQGMVYACSGLGRIACFDAATGKEIWSKHMVTDLGGVLSYFGYSESLLVDGNSLYCYTGGPDANVVCLDRLTGANVWTSKAMAQNAAFCSPIMITLPERKLFVTTSRDNLFALDAKNGELLWNIKRLGKKDAEYCNTPVYTNGYLYSVPGYDQGSGALKLKLSPDGKSTQEVWHINEMRNVMGGFVVANDKVYTTSKDKKLRCANSQTGAVVDSLKNISGNLIYADNKLFCYTDNGNMTLIDLSGTQMVVTGKFPIKQGTREHIAHPIIHNGTLYIRHGKAMMAYSIQ